MSDLSTLPTLCNYGKTGISSNVTDQSEQSALPAGCIDFLVSVPDFRHKSVIRRFGLNPIRFLDPAIHGLI